MSEPHPYVQSRISGRPPAEWPLEGSWALDIRLSVFQAKSQVRIVLDGSRDRSGGRLNPVWSSRTLVDDRPASYQRGLYVMRNALWETEMLLNGTDVRFEQH